MQHFSIYFKKTNKNIKKIQNKNVWFFCVFILVFFGFLFVFYFCIVCFLCLIVLLTQYVKLQNMKKKQNIKKIKKTFGTLLFGIWIQLQIFDGIVGGGFVLWLVVGWARVVMGWGLRVLCWVYIYTRFTHKTPNTMK